jgi:predicted oxidoreductase
MIASRVQLIPDGPELSRTICGVMRLREWGLSGEGLRSFIAECLDVGVTTFDHADIYGDYQCESIFGAALAAEPGLRSRMELVSKCGIKLVSERFPDHRIHHYDTSYDHIIESAERSLRNLHTDYLDLLLIHRPDPLMDADEVAAALTALRQSGKVRHVGVSNFTPSQFDLLASRLDFPLVTNQIELSVLYMDPLHDGTMDQLQRLRIAPMAWSPLGGARLFTSEQPQAQRVREALAGVAEQVGGAGLDQVALAWLHRIPGNVLPVLGTGQLDRIRAAVAAETLPLDRRQWFAIWEASAGYEVP